MGASVIRGDTLLPPGFAHPHSSEQARRIAERGTILRAQVGSGLHGKSITDQDDRTRWESASSRPNTSPAWRGCPTAGRITLPVPEPHRGYLRAVRRGEVALSEVVDATARAEGTIVRPATSSSVPDQPDRDWVDRWLHRSPLRYREEGA
jgi:hypothetical protein